MGTIANLIVRIGADTSDFNRGMQAATKGSNMLMAGVAVAGAAMLALGAKSVIAAGNMEQTTMAFTTMMGSAEDATALLKDLQKFAATTPFQFTEISTASKSLMAFGVTGDNMIRTLTTLGDIASGIGMPLNELSEIYGKIKAQGQVYGDDIRQLGQRGIPIIKELAKVFNMDESAIKKLVESGKVGFADIETAFQNMTAEGSQFGGLMEAQSKTLLGKWSNFKDSMQLSMIELGKSISDAFNLKGALDAENEALGRFTALLQSGGLGYALDQIFGEKTKLAIFAVAGAISFALIPSLINTTRAEWAALAPLLPLAALGAVIGALGYVVYKYATANQESSAASLDAAKASKEQADKAQTLKNRLAELQKGLGGVKTATKLMLAPFDEINKLSSSNNGALINSDATINEIAKINEELAGMDQTTQDIMKSINDAAVIKPIMQDVDMSLFGTNFQNGMRIIGQQGSKAWFEGLDEMTSKLFNPFQQSSLDGWGVILNKLKTTIQEKLKGPFTLELQGKGGFEGSFGAGGFGAGGGGGGSWATGGITTGRRDNVTVGEAGREAILPLESNTEWMDTLAYKIGAFMGGGGSGNTNVYVGNEQLHAITQRENNRRMVRSNGM